MDSAHLSDDSATAPPRPSRIRIIVRHPERSAALLALLIGFASVFSAVIAWRASIASIEASRYQSLAVQQQARREQIERELEGTVEQDQRFLAAFQQHEVAAHQLKTQADSIRTTDSAAADILDVESQSELALARGLVPFFLASGRATLGDDGTITYDKALALRDLQDSNVELRELRTSNVSDLANRADTRSIDLVGVAALVVGALFFLTVAQVTRGRPRVRQAFFVAGGVMVVVGTALFVLVEVLV